MARMIPAFIDPADSPPGEVELFGLLKNNCDDDWIVLHSLDLPQHVRQVEGELDFLILVPGGAAICLEVKSHERVQRDMAGMWRLGQDEPERRGPFRQAAEGMRSTKRRLKGYPGLESVPFVSAVAFPRCNFDVPALEWESWQVFDERLIRAIGLEECIGRAVRGARDKFRNSPTCAWFQETNHEPTASQCEQIRNFLRPVFERQRSPKERRAENRNELRQFTEEQFKALDRLERNDRIAFTGAAGTGKTFLALEATRRGIAKEQKVLLCCFNRLLGEWLRIEADPLQPNAWIGTFHALLYEIADISSEMETDDPGFWSEDLPSLAIDQLLRGHPLSGSFDLVVIDEAQDLCVANYLDVLDLLLRDGIQGGKIRVFGDFERQAIYTDSDGRDLLQTRTQDLVKYELTDNCRNRPRIGHLAGVVSGTKNPYVEFRRQDDGVNIGIARFGNETEQIGALTKAIDQLRNENFQLGDITILSPLKNGSAASLLTDPYRGWLTPAEDAKAGKIRVSTIQAFKGLESTAVIVTDVRSVHTSSDKQLLYIATSRATDRLFVLVDNNVAASLAELVIKGGT